MNCTRCGGAEAVVKRDAAFYCGKCALARDWEEVIALVQEERVMVKPAGGSQLAPEPTASSSGGGADLPADPFAS